jgi:dipeptidyl aminopeptidase/acylaminoacyl peptidase
MFVDAGFVFVEPDVRGSDGYGLDPCRRRAD